MHFFLKTLQTIIVTFYLQDLSLFCKETNPYKGIFQLTGDRVHLLWAFFTPYIFHYVVKIADSGHPFTFMKVLLTYFSSF